MTRWSSAFIRVALASCFALAGSQFACGAHSHKGERATPVSQETVAVLREFSLRATGVTAGTVSRDGKRVVVGTENGCLLVADMSGRTKAAHSTGDGTIRSVACDGVGGTVVAVVQTSPGSDERVVCVDAKTRRMWVVRPKSSCGSTVLEARVNDHGDRVLIIERPAGAATASSTYGFTEYDASGRLLLEDMRVGAFPASVSMSDVGRVIATSWAGLVPDAAGLSTSTVQVVSDGATMGARTFRGWAPVALSSDGQRLLIGYGADAETASVECVSPSTGLRLWSRRADHVSDIMATDGGFLLASMSTIQSSGSDADSAATSIAKCQAVDSSGAALWDYSLQCDEPRIPQIGGDIGRVVFRPASLGRGTFYHLAVSATHASLRSLPSGTVAVALNADRGVVFTRTGGVRVLADQP